jgi:hypothetical protein
MISPREGGWSSFGWLQTNTVFGALNHGWNISGRVNTFLWTHSRLGQWLSVVIVQRWLGSNHSKWECMIGKKPKYSCSTVLLCEMGLGLCFSGPDWAFWAFWGFAFDEMVVDAWLRRQSKKCRNQGPPLFGRNVWKTIFSTAHVSIKRTLMVHPNHNCMDIHTNSWASLHERQPRATLNKETGYQLPCCSSILFRLNESSSSWAFRLSQLWTGWLEGASNIGK